MREGDDPRDIYWRKSTAADQLVLARAGARDAPRRRASRVDTDATRARLRREDWSIRLRAPHPRRGVARRRPPQARRRRDRALAPRGERVRADATVGADPILRFLALLDRQSPGRVTNGRARAGRRPTSLAQARMRFGLVHRIMTDALATLGLLALVTSGELNRWVTVAIVLGLVGRAGAARALAGSKRSCADLGVVAPVAAPGRSARATLSRGQRAVARRGIRGRPAGHAPGDPARRCPRPAGHRAGAAAPDRRHRARRRSRLRPVFHRSSWSSRPARSSSATCVARSRATTARAPATAPGCRWTSRASCAAGA